jgi:hypothetical protein
MMTMLVAPPRALTTPDDEDPSKQAVEYYEKATCALLAHVVTLNVSGVLHAEEPAWNMSPRSDLWKFCGSVKTAILQ